MVVNQYHKNKGFFSHYLIPFNLKMPPNQKTVITDSDLQTDNNVRQKNPQTNNVYDYRLIC